MRWAARYAAEVKTLESKGSQSTIRHLLSFSILQGAGGGLPSKRSVSQADCCCPTSEGDDIRFQGSNSAMRFTG